MILRSPTKKLMELDKRKSDFISVASHELRTPRTAIKAFTERIPMKPYMTNEKRDRFLSIINNETDRLTRLISDILGHAKIEAGKFNWQVGPRYSFRRSSGHRWPTSSPVQTTRTSGSGSSCRIPCSACTAIGTASCRSLFTPDGGTIRCDAFSETHTRHQIVVVFRTAGWGSPCSSSFGIREIPAFRRRHDRWKGRDRLRPCHQQTDRGASRRPHLGGKRPGQGQHLLLYAPWTRSGRSKETG
jgi:hypothetical protein